MNPEAWLRLWRVPGIGPASFMALVETFGSPQAALDAGIGGWREAGLKPSQIEALGAHGEIDIGADLAWLEQPGNRLILRGSADYPRQLENIPSPPPLLYARGDVSLLHHPQLAVVGSRNPTQGGRNNAVAFSRHLAAAGLGITSGLAMGIDAAAHEGALQAGGITIAVMGTGLDRIYPARNRGLAHQIAEHGLLLSEFPIGATARAANFPRRNRIISGLALGVLVVEAAQKSGSLITARIASEQGREVFAIPGSIHNPLARGCHRLIRQGAKLVETADDILEELAPLLQTDRLVAPEPPAETENPDAGTIDPEHAALLRHIDFEPTAIDTIITRSGLTADVVSSMLLIMELNNLVAAEAGGYYVRVG